MSSSPNLLQWAGTSTTRSGCSERCPTSCWMFLGMGHLPTSLGNLCQCFTTLIVKNIFLTSSLNLPSFSLKPLPLVLSQQALLKCLSPSFLQAPFKYWKVSPGPSLLQAEQPQLSQPFLVAEVFQPSDHLCAPPLNPLQQLYVLLVLGAPELHVGLQVSPE